MPLFIIVCNDTEFVVSFQTLPGVDHGNASSTDLSRGKYIEIIKKKRAYTACASVFFLGR